MQSIHWLLQLTTRRDFIPKLWNPPVNSFRPTTKFFILLASSNYLSAPFCHLSLHFKGLLKQLSKHNYNWLAGSPFWVSEVLDKHTHIRGGYQCRWTHGHNTSKLGPIVMVQLLSIDQDSNLCLTKDARCLITWHQHLLGKSWTPSIGPRLHSTILASGMWDFKVSSNNFNSGIRFAFLRLTSISGISSANHRRHRWRWLSGTSHRQRFNIRPNTISQYRLGNPWVFCKLPRHRNTLGFSRCQILLLRSCAILTHLSFCGFK